jgi:hypothetical protein
MSNSSQSRRIIAPNEVISLSKQLSAINHTTFTVSEFFSSLKNYGSSFKDFADGIECQFLPINGKWQEGTAKLCIVFEPKALQLERDIDNTDIEGSSLESPLDDIRHDMSNNPSA